MKYMVIGVTDLRQVGKNGNSCMDFYMLAPLTPMDKRNGLKGQKVRALTVWNPGQEGGVIVEGDLARLPVLPFEVDVEMHSYNNKEYIDMITIGKTVPNKMML